MIYIVCPAYTEIYAFLKDDNSLLVNCDAGTNDTSVLIDYAVDTNHSDLPMLFKDLCAEFLEF